MPGSWRFVDATESAGLGSRAHVITFSAPTKVEALLGAIVPGDVDDDCWTDLVLDLGDGGVALLRNLGHGAFEDVTAAVGLDDVDVPPGTLMLADFSGDGALDLFIGGTPVAGSRMYINDGTGTYFERAAAPPGLLRPTYGAHFFDYDLDGDLDLFAAHWVLESPIEPAQYLFANEGDGGWTDVTAASRLADAHLNHTLAPRSSDLNGDGYPDLLIAGDFGRSALALSDGLGGFDLATPDAVSDENGMGNATGDVDGDGDIDWFVTAIWDEDGVSDDAWGVSGNRLYLGDGSGGFVDATEGSGVRRGSWGWGVCMQDLDNDGALDIYHGNGWHIDAPRFLADSSVLFVGAGDGTFSERAASVGLEERGQGRGVACFDYDRDGDIDLFLANHNQPFVAYRNDGAHGSWLTVQLRWRGGNRFAVGARVEVSTAGVSQIREVGAGSTYASHDPYEVHFGLAAASVVDRLTVEWPDGSVSVVEQVAANATVRVTAR